MQNFTTMESLQLSTARVEGDFLLQIGIFGAKVHNKNVPNVQVCNPTSPTQNSVCLGNHCRTLLILAKRLILLIVHDYEFEKFTYVRRIYYNPVQHIHTSQISLN